MSIKAVSVLTVSLFVASCTHNMRRSGTESSFESGDYIVTQESPKARQTERSHSAQSFIFHVTKSGEIHTIAKPPEIVAPRGIRADRSGRFVFADVWGPAIRVMTSQGDITTIYAGSPLTSPKDVAIDHDGGYVVADFATFTSDRLTNGGPVATTVTAPLGEMRNREPEASATM